MLLVSKTFEQLDEDERTLVLKELGSEQQYNAMRRISLALITSKVDLSPDPQTLRALEAKLHETNHAQTVSIVSMLTLRIPAYVSALLVVATVFITWAIHDRAVKPGTAVVEVFKRDTIFVTQTKIDTVFRDRIIYRTAKDEPTGSKNYFQVVKEMDSKEMEKGLGVSMKDKQELELLLVSGSE
jgi:hypothetical protein